MIRLQIGNYLFAPRLIPMLVAIVLVPLLALLGVWQLDRADQKREIDDGVKQAQAKHPLDLNAVISNNSNDQYDFKKESYRSALITGHYDGQRQYLLDNRTHKGRAGFHVLSVFLLDGSSNKAILINRGWIPYKGTRDNIPDISITDDTMVVGGVMKQQARSIVLNENSNTVVKSTYPKLIQSIRLTALARELRIDLLPVIIELEKEDKAGFIRDWQPYYGSIDKHNAYALQWFSFSAILLFLFIKLNTKKVKK